MSSTGLQRYNNNKNNNDKPSKSNTLPTPVVFESMLLLLISINSNGYFICSTYQGSASWFVILFRLTVKPKPGQINEINLKTRGMTWKMVGSNVKHIGVVGNKLQHAKAWVWNLKMWALA